MISCWITFVQISATLISVPSSHVPSFRGPLSLPWRISKMFSFIVSWTFQLGAPLKVLGSPHSFQHHSVLMVCQSKTITHQAIALLT